MFELQPTGGERQLMRAWRMRATLVAVLFLHGSIASADPQNCVYIFQDEVGPSPTGLVSRSAGPERAIPLANLMGHWPHFEVRVRPIWDYRPGQIEDCHATFYVGTSDETEVPQAFLSDFFRTKRHVAWVGFGAGKLDQTLLRRTFQHHVGRSISVSKVDATTAGFFSRVFYKGGIFDTELNEERAPTKRISATQYLPADKNAASHVLAWQIHSRTSQRIPYFLRANNKFLIADIPFESDQLRKNDRYFAFADLMFDILNEKPLRETPIALGRLEDIHGFYDLAMLRSALTALRDENVPINIAHIPLFVDPANTYGLGTIQEPRPATDVPGMVALLIELTKDSRNAILWHGVTHQLGEKPNPHTGISGHDFEFWDKVNNSPVSGDSPAWVLERLATGLSVFEAYGRKPRYWVTPHYEASALDNVIFGRVFPWIVGGATYYSSSFTGSFTLGAVTPRVAHAMPDVTSEVLKRVHATSFDGIDRQSRGRIAQDFPFEIYRDVYGQRVLPETLGYISVGVADQPALARDVDKILADAQRNRIVRDMWGSFFFHPYLLTSEEKGGIGRFPGDAAELKRLIIGLKSLGYRFISLEEFERSLGTSSTLR